MKVTVKTTEIGKDWEQYKEGLKRLSGTYVLTGVNDKAEPYPGGQSVAEVAMWNEFGTESVPERSFLRSSVDQNLGKIDQWAGDVVRLADTGKKAVDALNSLGFKLVQLVQNQIRSNTPPPYGTGKKPNSPEVVTSLQESKRRRGAIMGDSTLIETGHLLRNITYLVVLGRGQR